jgi:hypothetical protein
VLNKQFILSLLGLLLPYFLGLILMIISWIKINFMYPVHSHNNVLPFFIFCAKVLSALPVLPILLVTNLFLIEKRNMAFTVRTPEYN